MHRDRDDVTNIFVFVNTKTGEPSDEGLRLGELDEKWLRSITDPRTGDEPVVFQRFVS